MESSKIRQQFLDFFRKRGHKVVPSSSLIPDDPSVLFTTAGMQQFKKYYLDSESPYGNRVASIQKSIRTTDIDEVGDESHLTFFEMLGNFSFKFPEGENSYFKEEAIRHGYDFMVGELKIPLDRIKLSVFKGDPQNNVPEDRESLEIWKKLGIPEEKIIFGDKKDNFWGPTGDEGPCGPTAEIYVDGVEVWNIVFNEYYCDKEKHLVPLQRKGVDTGMGLERLALVLQNPEVEPSAHYGAGKKSVFETDLFEPLVTEIHGKKLGHEEAAVRSERIVADHVKASVFMISDGVSPSNVGRGYILRRLLRRVIRHGKTLNLSDDFYECSAKTLVNVYKDFYPELKNNFGRAVEIFKEERQKFIKVLEKGTKEFEKGIAGFDKLIPGPYAFGLQQSLGITLDIMQDIAREKNKEIDIAGFKEEEQRHKEISRVGQEKKFKK